MSEREQRLLRAMARATVLVEEGRAVQPKLAAFLISEIVRQRRVLETQERRLARLEKRNDPPEGPMAVRYPRNPEGPAAGEGGTDGIGGEDVHADDG